MPLVIVEDVQEYVVEETTFVYERLRLDDREQLHYLCSNRGQINETLYLKACIAVALKGWRNLHGQHGEIVFPALTVPPETGIWQNGTSDLAAQMLFPNVSQARQRQLDIVLALVERLPLNVVVELGNRVNELAPALVKKSSATPLPDNSALPTAPPDGSLPA